MLGHYVLVTKVKKNLRCGKKNNSSPKHNMLKKKFVAKAICGQKNFGKKKIRPVDSFELSNMHATGHATDYVCHELREAVSTNHDA